MTHVTRPMRVLLVDDDIHILTGLKSIISNHFTNQELSVFTCENGLIASQLLAEEPMDVLITDIKMPVCSGIELLTIINERHYDCRSVVLSGYDDFNLVRNAMRLGASDYLLKPVDEGLLIHTLREFQRLVPLSFPESAHPENTSLTTLLQMQNILETLISHSPAGVSEAQHFLTANRITGDTCCLMCYVDIKRALYSNHLGMFQFFSDRVNAFLKTSVLSGHQNFSVLYGGLGSYWVLLLFSEKAFSTPTDILVPLLSQLKQDHLKYSFTPAWFTFDQLADADILCKKGFEKYYFDLPYTRPEDASSPQNLAASMEQAVSAAAAYDYSGTIEHLEHCFSLLNYMHPSIPDVKKTFNRFVYSILNQNSNFIPAISSSKFTDYDILEHIETAESLSDLQKKIYFSVNQLIESLVQSMQDKDDYVIQKAKEYIQHNYQDDLTLNDVATHVFLNSNYFSTLFKQKTGDTFRNYLRNVRIEKAKELLSSTNLRIYEIALLVGYNEHSHFVRAFKTVTGKSPGEFRESSS